MTMKIDKKGFTAIELLVSLAILSIALTSIYSMYMSFIRTCTKEGAKIRVQQSVRSGLDMMIRDIRLAGLDPSLEEAAADLYASRWLAFRKVTLPLIMPGVIGGALLAFTMSLDDVVTTSFVSGPASTTLPVYVFGMVKKGVTPVINAVSTLMLLASMALVFSSLLVQRGGSARARKRKKEMEA